MDINSRSMWFQSIWAKAVPAVAKQISARISCCLSEKSWASSSALLAEVSVIVAPLFHRFRLKVIYVRVRKWSVDDLLNYCIFCLVILRCNKTLVLICIIFKRREGLIKQFSFDHAELQVYMRNWSKLYFKRLFARQINGFNSCCPELTPRYAAAA